MNEFLHIVTRMEGHERAYQVKGFGKEADRFSKWLVQHQVHREWDDFPWYGFRFVEASSEESLQQEFGQWLTEDDAVEYIPFADPVEEKLATELFAILQEEIQKEINNEMIDKLAKIK